MSTNAFVGVVNRDGSVNYVYNHYDSYISGGLGDFLKKKIKTIQQARKLIEGGDAESLESGSYYKEEDEDTKVKTVSSLEQFLNDYSSYMYYFKKGEWFVAYHGLTAPLKCTKEY